MKIKTITIMSALGLGLLCQNVWAGNITGINVSSLPNKQKVIKIKFDHGAVLPSGFTTDAPARIALDFADTGVSMAQNELEYSDALLKQIEAVQSAGRSRVVLSLNKSGQYNAEVKGQEVWIYVQESKTATAAPLTSTVTPPPLPIATINEQVITQSSASTGAVSTSATPTAPISVDFRKGRNNSGIVSVNVSSLQGTPSVKRQGDRLIFTYKNNPLPTEQQRNLDVADFSTPVRTVQLRRLGNDTELTLRMQGNWAYTQRTTGGNQIIEVSANTDVAASGLKTNTKSFNGRRVSLDFQDVDVRTILQILAKESGMNIVASDSVQGKMTISLKDVPWDQALDLVMQSRNLDSRREGNIINVAPRDELLARDKSVLQAQNEIDTLGPLLSQTFQLKYKNVEEFRKILKLEDGSSSSSNGNSNTILSARGSALIDPATNTLIITDIASVVKKFERLIAQLDVPAQQVMIEARIVEATDSFSRELGVKFGFHKSSGSNHWGSNWSDAINNSNTANNASNSTGLFNLNPNVNLPASAATSSIALVHSFASGALGLELSASQAEGKTKIISSPRVLTQDRKEASIESGTEIPYQEASSSGATSISFKKAVMSLKVLPQITPDGNIIMDVKVNKDSPDYTCTASEPCINTKSVDTRAMVENGGTLILGGIYQEENANSQDKVPLLGDIPVIGNLFKYQKKSQTRNELLIFITPRIMNTTGSALRY